MTYLSMPPPGIEDLIADLVIWIAKNQRAKVSLTVWRSESKHYTEEYDARGLKVGAGDTADKTPNSKVSSAGTASAGLPG